VKTASSTRKRPKDPIQAVVARLPGIGAGLACPDYNHVNIWRKRLHTWESDTQSRPKRDSDIWRNHTSGGGFPEGVVELDNVWM
jgi:hypothetical protein